MSRVDNIWPREFVFSETIPGTIISWGYGEKIFGNRIAQIMAYEQLLAVNINKTATGKRMAAIFIQFGSCWHKAVSSVCGLASCIWFVECCCHMLNQWK